MTGNIEELLLKTEINHDTLCHMLCDMLKSNAICLPWYHLCPLVRCHVYCSFLVPVCKNKRNACKCRWDGGSV